ncbi:hypothetical protein [Variovorax sp. GT1P44]|uniref:hypothetical protein n=1 Tax=Variovorax sp. GT1P44 TaxID=3443742 RepID=UPI003F4786FF
MPHLHGHEMLDVWSVEGRFRQLIYSPKGTIEGVLIDTDGVSTQFVVDRHDPALAGQLAVLREGQALVIEGTEADPSPKGEPEHTVYQFERLASVDGKSLASPQHSHGGKAVGTVVRFNYAKHGVANGVVLDSGDFIHTKPDGMARLGLKIGDKVQAEGTARPLATGAGRVIEARSVNGHSFGPAH